MSKFVRVLRRIGPASLAALGLAIAFQGCLSYDESGSLNSDGSGEVRIGFGVSGDKADPQKISEIRYAVKHLAGVHWIATLDSNSAGRHWHGAVVRFDSLAALRPLNTILPMENLFGNLRFSRTDSGNVWRRSVKLPTSTSDDHDFMKLSWQVPGRILAADRHAKWEKGSNLVTWTLPTDGASGEWAGLEVRWEEDAIPWHSFGWSALCPRTMAQWRSLGLAIATLLAALVAACLARRRVKFLRATAK